MISSVLPVPRNAGLRSVPYGDIDFVADKHSCTEIPSYFEKWIEDARKNEIFGNVAMMSITSEDTEFLYEMVIYIKMQQKGFGTGQIYCKITEMQTNNMYSVAGAQGAQLFSIPYGEVDLESMKDTIVRYINNIVEPKKEMVEYMENPYTYSFE